MSSAIPSTSMNDQVPGDLLEARHRVRVPGFLVEEDIGLGDLFKKITYSMGMRSCGACDARAEVLNRWMTISSSS